MGIGLAIASVASTTVGTTVAVPSERGLMSGLLNSAAQIGTALGLAVIIPLAARPESDPEVMLNGMRWGFLGAGVIAVLGLAAGLLLPARDRGEPFAPDKVVTPPRLVSVDRRYGDSSR